MIGQASNILNIAFILIIVLSILAGFIKGVRKSFFQLVFSIFFFFLALIMIPFIAEALLNANISSLKQYIPMEFPESVRTLREAIPYVLSDMLPDYKILFTPGSETLEIVYGVVKLVLIVVLFLLYFLLSITILKLVTLIIWVIVKPKEKVKKKRLMGALIGGVRGLLTVLLLAVPLAGLTSMYSSATVFINAFNSENSGSTEELESFEETNYEDLLTSYDSTWVAKIYDPTDLDEKMFDSVFKITVKFEDKKESVRIRKELRHAANIFEVVMEASGGELDENIIFKMSNEDLEEIKENLDKTNVLRFVQVVGVEYLYGEIKKNNLDKDYETHLTQANLKNIDLKGDIITLFTAIQIINRNEFEGTIEEKIFSFDEATATEIVEELAEIEWLSYLLPMGFNMLLNSESIQELMVQYDIDENSINKPSPEELIEDFKNIANVYITLKDLGVNNLEDAKNLLESENLMALEDEQVEAVVDVIFDFEILNSNLPLIAALGHNMLEQQEFLQGLITQDEFLANFDKEEIKHLVLLLKILVENDVLNENVDIDALLTEENINKISYIMANSKIISIFTPQILDMLFDNFSDVVYLEVPSDVSYKGVAGETELKALFNAIKTLNDCNLLSGDFDPSKITDENITDIANSLSSSLTIKHNITEILKKLLTDQGISNIAMDYERNHWTSDELSHTLIALKLLLDYKLLDSDFDIGSLTEEQIENLSLNLSSSNTIKDNIAPIIDQVIIEQGIGDVNVSDYGRDHWTEDEIHNTLMVFKLLGEYQMLGSNFDIGALTNEQIENLSDYFSLSNTVRDNITAIINQIIANQGLGDTITVDYEKDHWTNDEISNTLKSFRLLNEYQLLNVDFDITTLTDDQIDELSHYLALSNTIKDNITQIMNEVITNQGYDDVTVDYERDHWTEPEISSTLKAFKRVSEYQLLDADFDIGLLTEEQIENLSDHFSSSNTIKDNISPIMNQVITNQGYSDTITVDYERNHWTKNEISNTLKSLKLLDEYQMLDANFDVGALTNNQIDEISTKFSSSNTIKDNISPIMNQVITNQGYSDTIMTDYEGDHWTESEISSTLKSLKLLDEYQVLEPTFDIKTLTDDRLDNLSETFSSSNTVKDNITPIMNKLITNQGYTNLMIQNYERDHWTQYEIYHTLRAFRIVAGEDILIGDNSDKLAHSMSRSVAINSITKQLLEEAIKDYNYEMELQVLENEEYAGEDGELELKALFKAIKTLNEYNVLSSTFSFGDLDTDEKIDKLSTDLTASKTIRQNINGIINHLVVGKDYNFISTDYDDSHWTKDEVYYTISAFKVFDANNITSENIHTLTAEQIATISRSKTITGGFKNEVYRMNENIPENTSPLKGKLVIPEGLTWESTETTKGETENILLSMKEIQGTNDFSSFDPNIDALFGKDKNLVFASKIILHTFVDNHLKPLITDDDKLAKYFEPLDYEGNEYNWYGDEDNDAVAFVEALDDLNTAGINYNAMNFVLFKSILQSDPMNKPREINDALVQSKIVRHSLTKMLTELVHNQGGYTMIPIHNGHPDEWGTPGHDGKLIQLLETIAYLP